jgi:hypothetical protein
MVILRHLRPVDAFRLARQTHHATNLMERCPSLKLSCENARGLVIDWHSGAAAAVDQQSGGALPADVRDYRAAIAQAVSQLRLVGVNGPYSVSLSPANEPEPPLICAARNLKNFDDGRCWRIRCRVALK